MTAIKVHFLVEVVACRAPRDFDAKLRSVVDVVGGQPRPSRTAARIPQEAIGLDLPAILKAHSGVVAEPDAGDGAAVVAQLHHEDGVGLTVVAEADWRSQIHDSVDEFGLLDVRTEFVTAAELFRREAVAVLQRREPAHASVGFQSGRDGFHHHGSIVNGSRAISLRIKVPGFRSLSPRTGIVGACDSFRCQYSPFASSS